MFFSVEKLGKLYQGKPVLQDVTFSVNRGELVSIIGPSGVGKTTLLRILAGMETADSGTITFADNPDRNSPVIMVFQDYLLFPNLTVWDNVAFALKARKMRKPQIVEKVRAMLEFFHLEAQSEKYPVQLSAGQKQRVAIARAMIVNPAVLLLDEPFANLDRNLKLETAEFIRETQQSFGITTVSVTHDLEEAFAMSDRIGIMLDGQLKQYATPDEIYHAPATYDAACFLGPVNRLDASLCATLGITAHDYDHLAGVSGYSACLCSDEATMHNASYGVAGDSTDSDLATSTAPQEQPDKPLFVRPEALQLTRNDNGAGVVSRVTFGGHYIKYHVQVQGHTLVVYSLHNGLAVGDNVSVTIASTLGGAGSGTCRADV